MISASFHVSSGEFQFSGLTVDRHKDEKQESPHKHELEEGTGRGGEIGLEDIILDIS